MKNDDEKSTKPLDSYVLNEKENEKIAKKILQIASGLYDESEPDCDYIESTICLACSAWNFSLIKEEKQRTKKIDELITDIGAKGKERDELVFYDMIDCLIEAKEALHPNDKSFIANYRASIKSGVPKLNVVAFNINPIE